MGYYLGNKNSKKKISIKGLNRLYSTKTGEVYKYKNNALTVFKDKNHPPLTEETADLMTRISTDRILLPKKLLFYNSAFSGFTFRLVDQVGNGNRMIMLPKDELVGNLVLIEEDIETLSSKRILLDGIDPNNTFFNGDLFLTDPSRYSVLEDCDIARLEDLNKLQFHLLITELMAPELRERSSDKTLEKKLRRIMSMKEAEVSTSTFVAKKIGKCDSVKQYLKK